MKDGYKNGYHAGFSHASAGKLRNPKPPIITSVAAGRTFVNSYMSGYSEGHLMGAVAK